MIRLPLLAAPMTRTVSALNWASLLLLIASSSMLSGGYLSRNWLLFSGVFFSWFAVTLILVFFGAQYNRRAIKSSRWVLILLAVSLIWLSLPLWVPFEHALYFVFDNSKATGIAAPEWFNPTSVWSVDSDKNRSLLVSEFLMACIFTATVLLVDSRRRLKQLLSLLIVMGIVHASIGLVAKFGHVLLVDHRQVDGHFDVARGLFVNRNHFSAFLVLTLVGPFTFAWYWVINRLENQNESESQRRKSWFALALNTLIIVLVLIACVQSKSRGAVAALVIGVVVTVIISKRVSLRRHGRNLIIAMLILVLGVVTVGQDLLNRLLTDAFSVGERWVQWNITLRAIIENPLLGYGGGSYAHVFQTFRDSDELRQVIYAQSHNHFLHLWLERGLIGLMLWLMLIVLVFKRVYSAMKKVSSRLAVSALTAVLSVLIAALVQSLVDFNLQILNIRALFFVLLALVFAAPYVRH